MLFGGFGGGKIAPGKASFPGGGATLATGFSSITPSKFEKTLPFGGGVGKKSFGFPGFGKFGKTPGFGKFGKIPFGFGKGKKPFGFGKGKKPFGFVGAGKPSKSSGFNFAVPATTVATTPSAAGGGKFGI